MSIMSLVVLTASPLWSHDSLFLVRDALLVLTLN